MVKRNRAQSRLFKRTLSCVNILYVGCSVLILIDRSTMSRFWTQFECWLSCLVATADGFSSAPLQEKQDGAPWWVHLECMGSAPLKLKQALLAHLDKLVLGPH